MSQDDKRKEMLKNLKTRPLDRNFAMAKLGVITGSKVARHNLRNFFRDKETRGESNREFYTEQARYLAGELGQLKGSIMKVGQMLSIYARYFMAPEVVEVLRSLQDDSPPVAWSTMRPVLEKSLGSRRMAELDIDPEPLAAASLGQVHRARLRSDGTELCIKIQYPGVSDAIDSDVRTMTRLVSMARLIPRGVALQPIMEEVRQMLHREVDYDAELQATQTFHERLKDDPRFAVPQVFPAYSTDRVLTTSWEPGEKIQSEAVGNLSQERRDRLAGGALELFLQEFFRWSMVQTDPHFGNYRVRIGDSTEEDQLVLLDFGATRWFDPAFVGTYQNLVLSAFNHDGSGVISAAERLNLMFPHYPENVHRAFTEVCYLIVEPFMQSGENGPPEQLLTEDGKYDWGNSDLPNRVTRTISRAALSRYFRVPPREIVFLHRRMGGVFMLLASLGATLDAHDLLAEYLDADSDQANPA